MAHPIKDGCHGQKSISDPPTKLPSRTLIIPSKDLVQVVAKVVPVTRDGFTNELQHEKLQELMTDSIISQSRHVDLGRELERWVPAGWDQFEANETLFGVKSTFDEKLYTTKLERGPQMTELEREALRIAREIEGEETLDLHLAEERGIQLNGNLEMGEETRFSSVYRGADDSGYNEIDDRLLDSQNDETFSGAFGSLLGKTLIDTRKREAKSESFDCPKVGLRFAVKIAAGESLNHFVFSVQLHDLSQVSKAEAPPKQQGTTSSLARPSSFASSTSDRGGATSTSARRGLSPSSSVGSLSSEKSTLNPHAKEFKFNPNAKSFMPSQTPLWPSSPVADSPFYYPANMTAALTHMNGMPVEREEKAENFYRAMEMRRLSRILDSDSLNLCRHRFVLWETNLLTKVQL
ncbi:hypothetical protein DH2020_013044 [Rehmannia glutinosa]|uniref:LsmAD domain-containing protein n=1 Tax=Rehmannia glutinosa TaxID=99300 RepID=A0ABR0X4Z0_REHGL